MSAKQIAEPENLLGLALGLLTGLLAGALYLIR